MSWAVARKRLPPAQHSLGMEIKSSYGALWKTLVSLGLPKGLHHQTPSLCQCSPSLLPWSPNCGGWGGGEGIPPPLSQRSPLGEMRVYLSQPNPNLAQRRDCFLTPPGRATSAFWKIMKLLRFSKVMGGEPSALPGREVKEKWNLQRIQFVVIIV